MDHLANSVAGVAAAFVLIGSAMTLMVTAPKQFAPLSTRTRLEVPFHVGPAALKIFAVLRVGDAY